MMKVSIITVSFNSEKTIRETILSVADQDYENIEYIIIDGGSIDNTNNIISEYSSKIAIHVSEKDGGIYEAMNKGIAKATGDIIAFLNSDDTYCNNHVVSDVIKEFKSKNVDSIFSDVIFVSSENPSKIVRYYRSAKFSPNLFAYGVMPAHPTFFAKKSVYDNFGNFKLSYKIAADFEILVRFLAKCQVSYSYLPKTIIAMKIGGVSTKNFRSNIIINNEIYRACKENNIKTNYIKIYSKYFVKIFQFIKKPKTDQYDKRRN